MVDAEAAGPEGGDLKQPARDRDVLEEMRHRVLVSKVVVKTECRRDRENRHYTCDDPALIAEDQ